MIQQICSGYQPKKIGVRVQSGAVSNGFAGRVVLLSGTEGVGMTCIPATRRYYWHAGLPYPVCVARPPHGCPHRTRTASLMAWTTAPRIYGTNTAMGGPHQSQHKKKAPVSRGFSEWAARDSNSGPAD